LNGEGWSLNVDEFKSIFFGANFITKNYRYSEQQVGELFKLFDTDSNGLIDAMEMLITIALMSGFFFSNCFFSFLSK
jgi:hypothetical protein